MYSIDSIFVYTHQVTDFLLFVFGRTLKTPKNIIYGNLGVTNTVSTNAFLLFLFYTQRTLSTDTVV